MNRVGETGVGLPDGYFRRSEGGRGDSDERLGYGDGSPRTRKEGLRKDTAAGQFELGARDRSDDFRERMQRELGKDHHGDGSPKDDASTVLLALAGEGVAVPSVPGFALSGLPSVGNAPGPGWVEQLCDRIEQSVRAEMRTSGRHEFSLHLDLQNTGIGIAGLQITMTANSIDVVLVGSAVAANPGFVPEVQALANRLQTRFSRRVVRIHEATDAAGGDEVRGLDEISRLLTHQGPGT